MKLLLLLALTFSAFGSTYPNANTQKISFKTSLDYLLKNINPAGTVDGIVVASPSKSHPNYFFHWVRDAGLVISTVMDVALYEQDTAKKAKLLKIVDNYAKRVVKLQKASGFEGLGEPKYNVDGSPFTGPWGRPQHDGPALRSIALMKYANYLLDQGKEAYVLKHLYAPTLPALSPIKMDLEYVARKWNEQGFDYWEEVMGLHFSTAMDQRKALIMGAKLATRLNDSGAAKFYLSKIKDIEGLINKFYSKNKKYIQSTLYQTRGVWKSQLDISVVLGVLHGETKDGFYSVTNPKVLNTVLKLEESFNKLYRINKVRKDLGTSFGRYPEDTYNGYDTNGEGHGWFLATFAMAQFHLKLAKKMNKNYRLTNVDFYCKLINIKDCKKKLTSRSANFKRLIVAKLKSKAMGYFRRCDFHAGDNGHMSEQMNRHSGFMEGARDLTWSYASHLSALLEL